MPWMIINCDVPTEVDDIDFGYLSGFKFCLIKSHSSQYLVCTNKGKHRSKALHVIIAERMGLDTTNDIDHKDRDVFNNKRTNLRPATRSQNNVNSKIRSDNKSGVKGVYFSEKDQNWYANIRVKGVLIHLGCFGLSKESASKRRKEAEIEYYGEFST